MYIAQQIMLGAFFCKILLSLPKNVSFAAFQILQKHQCLHYYFHWYADVWIKTHLKRSSSSMKSSVNEFKCRYVTMQGKSEPYLHRCQNE